MAGHKSLSLLAVALLAVACTDSGSSHYSASLVDIGGGRKMQLECDGVGTPTVLLVSGKGDRADTWSTHVVDPHNPLATVFRQVVRFTRVCAYDRPATVSRDKEPSRSDPVHHPAGFRRDGTRANANRNSGTRSGRTSVLACVSPIVRKLPVAK